MQRWALATLLVRRHPDHSLIEIKEHTYLTLVKEPKQILHISRSGHVFAIDPAGRCPATLQELFTGDYERGLTDLEHAIGLDTPKHTPTSTPAVLTFRTIAQLMAIVSTDKRSWDVRSVWFDCHEGGSAQEKYLMPFPVAAQRAKETRRDDYHQISYLRYWVVLRVDKPVAVLDTDGFVYVGDQVLSLPEIYSAHSRKLTPTVAASLGTVLP